MVKSLAVALPGGVLLLDIITRNYPVQSSWWLRLTWPPDDIRHIRGIWTDFKLLVMDEVFTLGEVERRLFQKTFDDPRVYLALTYASRSSPSLRRQPYPGPDLDRQLDEQVRQFLASPQGLQIDRRGMVVRLSALFKPTWRGAESSIATARTRNSRPATLRHGPCSTSSPAICLARMGTFSKWRITPSST